MDTRTIAYSQTIVDLAECQAILRKAAAANNYKTSRLVWFVVVLFVLACVATLVSDMIRQRLQANLPTSLSGWLELIGGFVVCLAILSCFVFTKKLDMLLLSFKLLDPEAKRRYLGRRKLTLTPESVTIELELFSSSVRWHAIQAIVATETHLFFLLTPREAYVVPMRAFLDRNEADEFVREAKDLRMAAIQSFREHV